MACQKGWYFPHCSVLMFQEMEASLGLFQFYLQATGCPRDSPLESGGAWERTGIAVPATPGYTCRDSPAMPRNPLTGTSP